ncbi:MAG: bifunctional phosphoribosylaminoimidazolecarboxamide formyltransferase/IMP cyclohydrolase [Firmicutes bacterium]|nr:bifunctional phosphoribosylaminoimidazolecarboxamide formyltransferase/IMP cyclohydrolase [Bacillota bacterium]
MVKRALISVYDKTGLIEFAGALNDLGIEILSTGGTARALAAAGIPVRQVSDETGFPEILDGRVKTLHPRIHAALLARRDLSSHMEQIAEKGIKTIDIVVVNLYPFREVASREGVPLEEVIENIDIGGPSMLRSAAKNHEGVVVVCDPRDYEVILREIRGSGDVARETRLRLAVKAFAHTAHYDALISSYLVAIAGAGTGPLDLPDELTLGFEKVQAMRYGENPHQKAAFYREPFARAPSLATARQLHGKELSFNNINDTNAALELVMEFDGPAAVAVKHANPCGVGLGSSPAEAFSHAYDADPVSIFGGIVALNRPVDAETAKLLSPVFIEVLLAPEFDGAATDILFKKKDIRVLATGRLPAPGGVERRPSYDLKKVSGGLLIQESDQTADTPAAWRCVTTRRPTPEEAGDLAFSWKVCKYVKSNAIVLARGGQTVGIGAGQMSRIGAARIAIEAAGDRARGSVMASDAFFPFPDVVGAAATAGVTAIVQPGGSVRDTESIAAADHAGIAMVFTGIRHFRH